MLMRLGYVRDTGEWITTRLRYKSHACITQTQVVRDTRTRKRGTTMLSGGGFTHSSSSSSLACFFLAAVQSGQEFSIIMRGKMKKRGRDRRNTHSAAWHVSWPPPSCPRRASRTPDLPRLAFDSPPRPISNDDAIRSTRKRPPVIRRVRHLNIYVCVCV